MVLKQTQGDFCLHHPLLVSCSVSIKDHHNLLYASSLISRPAIPLLTWLISSLMLLTERVGNLVKISQAVSMPPAGLPLTQCTITLFISYLKKKKSSNQALWSSLTASSIPPLFLKSKSSFLLLLHNYLLVHLLLLLGRP